MIHLSRWKVILLVLSLLFGLFFAYPNVLSPAQREALPGWLPKSALNLGLDLQGGSYLLLEVDVPAMREKRLTNLGEDARTVLAEARRGDESAEDGRDVPLANPRDGRGLKHARPGQSARPRATARCSACR